MKKGKLLVAGLVLGLLLSGCSLDRKGGGSNSENISSPTDSGSVGNNTEEGGGSQNHNKKISFNDLSNFIADIAGANAFGIMGKRSSSRKSLKRSGDEDDQTKTLWVMTNDYHEENQPHVLEDGSIAVSFMKTVITNSAEEVTVTRQFSVDYKEFNVDILKITSNGIFIPFIENRQYRIKTNEEQTDWLDGEKTTTILNEGTEEELSGTFTYLSYNGFDIDNCKIDSRSTNSDYSFLALEDDKYSILNANGNAVYSDIVDNGDCDLEAVSGRIKVNGLVEGEEYTLRQVGIRYTETITQEQIDGKIDKLLVAGKYTFLSFVPEDLYNNIRPLDDQLSYDSDGICSYDKVNYYSDNTRQSFVVDNTSGLVYKITNFNIVKIKNGLIYTNINNLVYDMRINNSNELEFFSLFSNSSINVFDAFKDRYNNIYIRNDKINTYDTSTRTFYYVFEEGNSSSVKFIDYQLNENKEAVKLVYSDEYSRQLNDLKLINAEGQEVAITQEDSFKIETTHSAASIRYFEVVKGIARGMDCIENDRFINGSFDLAAYDCTRGLGYWTWCITYNYEPKCQINTKLLQEYDVLLLWDGRDSCLYALYDFYAYFFDIVHEVWTITNDYNWVKAPLTIEKVLDACDIDSNTGCIINYGLNGNTYYDFDIITENGNRKVDVFELGTRTENDVVIKLQPINF